MVTASQMRTGMAVRYEGQTYKVLAADYHPGQGKMGGVNHARLQNLATGSLWEHSFRADLKLEELSVEKQPMDFLYADAGDCNFMNPDTFEQVSIPAAVVGPQARFLLPEMRVTIEFVEGQPVSVLFPDILEVRVADTAPPSHQQQESVRKPARLDNGAEIMVPQFIKVGDVIRLDVANLKYIDRAKGATKG
ncbi:MAG: elongation factor P [Acidobacteria bacterium]|nr:elongation factor P [Acidobacteriota bacterium]